MGEERIKVEETKCAKEKDVEENDCWQGRKVDQTRNGVWVEIFQIGAGVRL